MKYYVELEKALRIVDTVSSDEGIRKKCKAIRRRLKELEVVEVVCCKECKQWQRNVGLKVSPNGHCFYHGIETNGLDYCSYGEKKEGAKE